MRWWSDTLMYWYTSKSIYSIVGYVFFLFSVIYRITEHGKLQSSCSVNKWASSSDNQIIHWKNSASRSMIHVLDMNIVKKLSASRTVLKWEDGERADWIWKIQKRMSYTMIDQIQTRPGCYQKLTPYQSPYKLQYQGNYPIEWSSNRKTHDQSKSKPRGNLQM